MGLINWDMWDWEDESIVFDSGSDETRGSETVDDGSRVCDTGKMRELAGARVTDLDELQTINNFGFNV